MRSRLRLLALALWGLSAGVAFAQAPAAPWPTKAVKFVNSFPPGGPSDILARAVGDLLQKQYGQPFVVENRAGAAGNVGADAVAKSAADGYTLLWGIDTTHTINPHIYRTMPFRDSDLKPVVVISSSGLLLGVHPSTGWKSFRDFLQAARDLMPVEGIIINDPVPMTITRVAGVERAQLLIECASRAQLQAFLKPWLAALREQKSRLRWSLEVDPVDI